MSDDISNKLPQRTNEHVHGDRALDVFNFRRKPEWARAAITPTDYGWDLLLTITENERVKDDFFVQLKGHDKPNYIEGDEAISEPLKVSTIRWLLSKPEPTMICVCDLGQKDNEPVYYVWLQKAMEEIIKNNPTWEKQESISLRMPTSNIFASSAHPEIEKYVKEHSANLRINKTIGEIISPSIGSFEESKVTAYIEKPYEFVVDKVAPILQEVGLLDIKTRDSEKEIEAFTVRERELFVKLNKASTFLNSMNDIDASRILKELDKEIDKAPDGLRAKYFNCNGVLSLRSRNIDEALKWFEKGYELRPKDPKISTNYNLTLLAQYHFSRDKQSRQIPKGISDRLDEIIRKNPTFLQAVRVKAYFLGDTATPNDAFDFLKTSSAFEKDPVEARICMAEIYKEHDRIDDAIVVLQQISEDKDKLELNYFALYAFLLFDKATGNQTGKEKTTFYGAGPKTLNVPLLKEAVNYYENAFRILSLKGFPNVFEETVVNYATALDLLGYHEKAERVIRSYLEHHAESIPANAALASNLFKQGKYPQAVKFARIAFLADKSSSTAFINFLLALFLSDQFEDVLRQVSDRISYGFKNKREEGVARSMAAFAYSELGLEKNLSEQISFLENDKELKADAIIVRASIIKDRYQRRRIFQEGLAQFPDNQRLLDQYLGELIPVKRETSGEVINVVNKISEYRQLLPEEYYNLGHAYLQQNLPDKAEEIFRGAVDRFPNEKHLLFDHAITLYLLGYEDKSYDELKRYLEEGKRDYSVLKNLAIVARNTGRIDESIKLLSQALMKTKDATEAGEIHCQLFELKRRRESDPKELLHHVVEYGKTTKNVPEDEARYLMLFLTSPDIPEAERDPEVVGWVAEFRDRLQKFTSAHPNFKSFRMFSLPSNASGEEIRQDLMSTIASMSLPHLLATASMKIATRSGEWPLVFRAHTLYSKNIFEYWSMCVSSKEVEHAIHIWRPANELLEEIRVAADARSVVVDITALLTLAEFDLFNVLNIYESIILPWDIRRLMDMEMRDLVPARPIAKKIQDWMMAQKQKIRLRSSPDGSEEKGELHLVNGLFQKKEPSVRKIFSEGVGEALLLAKHLGLPLFSDESFVRSIGKSNFGIKGFCTATLLVALRQKGLVHLGDETKIYSQMILKNYILIPFTSIHLMTRLKELIADTRFKDKGYVSSEIMTNDQVLMSLLNQFANPDLHQVLAPIAFDWWLSIAEDTEMSSEQLAEAMYYIAYCYSMRTISSVLDKIHQDEPEKRLAGVLAMLLWQAYKKNKEIIPLVWSALKSCVGRYFQDKEEKVIYELTLRYVKNFMEKDQSLNDNQKALALYEIPEYLPFTDKAKFINYFTRHKPSFSY